MILFYFCRSHLKSRWCSASQSTIEPAGRRQTSRWARLDLEEGKTRECSQTIRGISGVDKSAASDIRLTPHDISVAHVIDLDYTWIPGRQAKLGLVHATRINYRPAGLLKQTARVHSVRSHHIISCTHGHAWLTVTRGRMPHVYVTGY